MSSPMKPHMIWASLQRREMSMKNKEMFISALTSLMFTWGGDTPNEAVWVGNDLLNWYDKEYGTTTERFKELEKQSDLNFDAVIASL